MFSESYVFSWKCYLCNSRSLDGIPGLVRSISSWVFEVYVPTVPMIGKLPRDFTYFGIPEHVGQRLRILSLLDLDPSSCL